MTPARAIRMPALTLCIVGADRSEDVSRFVVVVVARQAGCRDDVKS